MGARPNNALGGWAPNQALIPSYVTHYQGSGGPPLRSRFLAFNSERSRHASAAPALVLCRPRLRYPGKRLADCSGVRRRAA